MEMMSHTGPCGFHETRQASSHKFSEPRDSSGFRGDVAWLQVQGDSESLEPWGSDLHTCQDSPSHPGAPPLPAPPGIESPGSKKRGGGNRPAEAIQLA